MTLTPFEFRPFCDLRLQETKDAWTADAHAGLAFPSETERLLDWVTAHREPSANDSVAFGVFLVGTNVALGISEIVIQRKTVRSKWVKMLRLHLRSNIDAELQDGNQENAMNVFLAAIEGSLDLQLTHMATTLKIYGRTSQQLNYLKSLVSKLNNVPKLKFAAKIDGRFLSLVYKAEPLEHP
jgi:hypothetical protein